MIPARPPQRIQRKRTKGWRMPPNTVYVGLFQEIVGSAFDESVGCFYANAPNLWCYWPGTREPCDECRRLKAAIDAYVRAAGPSAASGLDTLRQIIVNLQHGTPKPILPVNAEYWELAAIHKTLNVVLAELDTLQRAERRPPQP